MKYSEDLNGFELYSELECFKNQAYNLMDNFKSARFIFRSTKIYT